MPSLHHDIFNDPLFGDGADQAPPKKPAWPREDLDFRQHTGSAQFFKWSILFGRCGLTEGAKDVAERCGSYWLMDIIGSVQPTLWQKHAFQLWRINVTHGDPPPKPWVVHGEELEGVSRTWGLVTCEDGNDKVIYRQLIPYTDFPLAELKLFACRNELGGVTIMLPSEY